MTLIVEDGSGVDGANSYATIAEMTAYLTDRNRQSENSFDTIGQPAQEAALIAGTDFIEQRFRDQFRGVKKWFDIAEARTVLAFTQQPADGETVTIGTTVLTFRATVTIADEVEIGANLPISIANLAAAIVAADEGVSAFEFFGDTLFVSALLEGTAGNGIATTTTVTGATFSFPTTRGGNDDHRPQPLSFPRARLFDRDGRPLLNIPARLKQAVFEYASRAVVGILQADITPNASGRIVTRTKVKVGPIETETGFDESGGIQLAIYPAADNLIAEFINPGGGAFR